MNKKAEFLAVIYCLISFPVYGQSASVYLHTDRISYFPGESVLFKAYFLDDLNNRTVPANDTLHLYIYDQYGLEIASAEFPVSNNMLAGKINIPTFITEGNYILVAYSNSMKNLSPDRFFSRIIEINNPHEEYLYANLQISDSVYDSGDLLTAQIRFSGKDNKPLPATFSYHLTGKKEEIINGNNKANSDGFVSLKLQLPKIDGSEILRLIIISSYKGSKNIKGVVIPTKFNHPKNNLNLDKNLYSDNSKQLNIQLKTESDTSELNEKIQLQISVTDNNGDPVIASLSISASNLFAHQPTSGNDNLLYHLKHKNDKPEDIPATDIKDYFTRYLIQKTESPGHPYILQAQNNAKRLHRKDLSANEKTRSKTQGGTLFWGPNIITDNSGKASVSFSTNDMSTEVLISADGMAANGNCGSNSIILYQNAK